jgi:hypothetical protein
MKMMCQMWLKWALPPRVGASRDRCRVWYARSVGDRFGRWGADARAQRANLIARQKNLCSPPIDELLHRLFDQGRFLSPMRCGDTSGH